MRNRRIELQSTPSGPLRPDHFAESVDEVPHPADGELLCRTVLLSIDASNRAWMQGRTYRDRLDGGHVMPGLSLCEVMASKTADISPGDLVLTEAVGWQEYGVATPDAVRLVQPYYPLTAHMGPLGLNGLTAYFGLLEIGRPLPGECVLVSGAAGATGHLVGQVAHVIGARVVGIAGSPDKLDVLENKLGFDATVSHRDPNLHQALRSACPDGVDVYFDNVGGELLNSVLAVMNLHGRIVCCGAVSQYDRAEVAQGPSRVPGMLITKRLTMQGFITSDYSDRYSEAELRLAGWLEHDAITALDHIHDGLASAPAALMDLLAGANLGKTIVRVGHDPSGGNTKSLRLY